MPSPFDMSRIPAIAVGLVVVVAAGLVAGTAAIGQQKEAQENAGNKITGELVSVSKKGRNTILTVATAEDGEQEFVINARVKFSVTAKGDKAFLAKGQFVLAEATQSRDNLFAKLCTVVVRGRGPKPKPILTKAPEAPGRSQNAFWLAGTVVVLQQDKQYPEYDSLTLRIGSKSGRILLEKGYQVRVQCSDPDLAKAGAKVELEGKRARGNRFLLAKATVTLDETLKAEDFLTDSRKSKKRRSKK